MSLLNGSMLVVVGCDELFDIYVMGQSVMMMGNYIILWSAASRRNRDRHAQ